MADAIDNPLVKNAGDAPASQRIDKWLWCARFAKTRTAATRMVAGGGLRLSRGEETVRVEKPSMPVRLGDRLAFLLGDRLKVVEVAGFALRRGPAREAQALYEDHSPPPTPKSEKTADRGKGAGRPTKRDRRAIERLKAGERE